MTPASSVANAEEDHSAKADGSVKQFAPGQQLLNTYCIACHGKDKQKGKIRFDTLDQLHHEKRTELLTLAQEVIHFGEMPPPEDPQPSDVEMKTIMGWLGKELASSSADAIFAERMLKPGMGNYVDHDDLFSGEYADLPASTPARRWLISPYIFHARMNEILEFKPTRDITGFGRQHVIGDNLRVPTRTAKSQSSSGANSAALTNPFQLPKVKGVQYFDTEAFHGGHLLTMLGNAESTTSFLMDRIREGRFKHVPMIQELMALQWDQELRLAEREYYLNNFMYKLLPELYGERNEAYLPDYEPVEVQPFTGDPKDLVRFGTAAPPRDSIHYMFHTAKRLLEEGDTPEALAERCQREWFKAGVDRRTLTGWMTFMRDYSGQMIDRINNPKSLEYRRYKEPQYRPLPEAEMQIVAKTIRKNRKKGDFYDDLLEKSMEQWRQEFQRERDEAGYPTPAQMKALVEQSFLVILNRKPGQRELDRYAEQTFAAMRATDRPQAIQKLVQTLMLRSEFVYRYELGENQSEDDYGRRMLSPRELSYAISYALTDSSPDEELVRAAEEGRLSTREDVEREVKRMLAKRDQWYIIDERVDFLPGTDSITNMPIRELRFFRDFFGYPKLIDLFKDNKRFGGNYQMTRGRLVDEADILVAHIVEKDQNVFENLLTTDEFFVFHSGDRDAMKAGSDNHRKFYDYFSKLDWQKFNKKQMLEHEDFFKERRVNPHVRSNMRHFKTYMTTLETRFGDGQKHTAPFFTHNYFGPGIATRTKAGMRGEEVIKTFNLDMNSWDYPIDQPTYMPNRKGILTHPAWLIAHSQNTETDPVIRGLWVRMMLLAGTVPDVPINVDAVVPPDKTRTLRQRHVSVTEQDACWRCHIEMNPLGYPFEMYDDFGRYRTEEALEHPDNIIKKNPDPEEPPFDATSFDLRDIYKTLPVDPSGYLSGTGDPELDGEVKDALDLIDRLAKSDRVRQSIIRHAFRYFMGRNEVLSDSSTLIEADKAYVESGGSFDAVITSLLTSDSFLYRVDPED